MEILIQKSLTSTFKCMYKMLSVSHSVQFEMCHLERQSPALPTRHTEDILYFYEIPQISTALFVFVWTEVNIVSF